ncbi:MAG: hypothetical protein M0Q88_01120 [Bacilli bacterium]|nr:hypothetical protein [Bacilli bacterium]
MFKATTILHKHIETIAKAMEWEEYPFITTGSGYYFTWENVDEDDVEEIFEKTGIKCKLSNNRTLLVPEYKDFKSEKQKELLFKLEQYGNTMMMLDMIKKIKPEDLRTICKEMFSLLNKKIEEEEMRVLIEQIIDKVS